MRKVSNGDSFQGHTLPMVSCFHWPGGLGRGLQCLALLGPGPGEASEVEEGSPSPDSDSPCVSSLVQRVHGGG